MGRASDTNFYAFDLLAVDGEDLRHLPLIMDHLVGCGVELFRAACQRDLEGIVGKWRDGRYEINGQSTSWVKIKNPTYWQMTGRRELFEQRQDRRQRRGPQWRAPLLRLRHCADAEDR